MLRNSLKIALRNLRHNKAYSLLNIAGLSIGMTAAILIFLWVNNEMSYDSYHPQAAHKPAQKNISATSILWDASSELTTRIFGWPASSRTIRPTAASSSKCSCPSMRF